MADDSARALMTVASIPIESPVMRSMPWPCADDSADDVAAADHRRDLNPEPVHVSELAGHARHHRRRDAEGLDPIRASPDSLTRILRYLTVSAIVTTSRPTPRAGSARSSPPWRPRLRFPAGIVPRSCSVSLAKGCSSSTSCSKNFSILPVTILSAMCSGLPWSIACWRAIRRSVSRMSSVTSARVTNLGWAAATCRATSCSASSLTDSVPSTTTPILPPPWMYDDSL